MLNRNKWFTLIELLIVLALIIIFATFINNTYTWYIQDWKDEKRLLSTQWIWSIMEQVFQKNTDFPSWYCTNDWITYDDSCFQANWCTNEITCDSSNNYCSWIAWSSYIDIWKLAQDYSIPYESIPSIKWESYPNWMSYIVCSRNATSNAYQSTFYDSPSWFTWTDVQTSNPSFIFYFTTYDGDTKRVVYTYSENF